MPTQSGRPEVVRRIGRGIRPRRRALEPTWSEPDRGDSSWLPVQTIPFDLEALVAPAGPPVRCTQELHPASVERRPDGRLIVDFGQNFAGRVRLSGDKAGPEVVVRHAEVLQGGELYVRTLRTAVSIDRYLSAGGRIDWEPRFTIHGFRFAEISGWEGDPAELKIVGRVYHSDMPRTGWFTCLNDDVNRLHEAVVWSMRSNFVDIPTDCPQRDERLGWTGDIQVFTPTAAYLFDCSGFLNSWLADLAIEQGKSGTVPWFVPNPPAHEKWCQARPAAVWGDVAVLTPWDLF